MGAHSRRQRGELGRGAGGDCLPLHPSLNHHTRISALPSPPPAPRAGNQSSGVMLGLQVPAAADADLAAVIADLAPDFTFTEMGGRAREVFKMFIQ